jgi:hypothetical protein
MQAVLGIDAAWTVSKPSRVALAVERSGGWQVIAAASSYQCFYALVNQGLTEEQRPSGSLSGATFREHRHGHRSE